MAELFRTGDGSVTDKIIVALELVDNDWFKRNFIHALELMCEQFNWEQIGDASADFARDKSNEMLESVVFEVIIPTLPIGSIEIWLSATIPDKWLLLNGAGKSKTTYPELFDVFGYTYGGGGDTFVLPTMQSLIPMGVGGYIALGQLKGGTHHNIQVENLPPHTHPPLAPSTTFFGLKPSSTNSGAAGTTYGTTATTGSTGDGVAMEIVPPVIGVNFIVYAGH